MLVYVSADIDPDWPADDPAECAALHAYWREEFIRAGAPKALGLMLRCVRPEPAIAP